MKIFAVLLFLIPSISNAQCVYPQPDGTLNFTAQTAADCSGYWFIPAAEYSAYLASVEITLADTSAAFVWGFGTVVFFAALAFKVGLVRKVVGMA